MPEYPVNDFTRMIELVAQRNAQGAVGVPGIASGEPQPTVRSRDLGRIIEAANVAAQVPLSPEDVNLLNAQARAAGVKDESLGNAPPEGEQYGTFEDALAAGASVRPPVVEPVVTRQSPRGPVSRSAPQVTVAVPRLPDFRKVQGIDLMTGVVLVDDMEFPIPEEELQGMREYAVRAARDHIMQKLEEAVSLFSHPDDAEALDDEEAESETVQLDPEGDSAEPQV